MPPTKMQRTKLGDLRSGVNLTEALATHQSLFNEIRPENIVLRSGTANTLNSGTNVLKFRVIQSSSRRKKF